MRLVCPNCEAKYEVPEDAIPETGRDVQCANCGHAWYQMRPRAAVVEPPPAAAPVAAPVVAPPMASAPAPVPEAAPAPAPVPVVEAAPVAATPVAEPVPETVPEPEPMPEREPAADPIPEPEVVAEVVAEVAPAVEPEVVPAVAEASPSPAEPTEAPPAVEPVAEAPAPVAETAAPVDEAAVAREATEGPAAKLGDLDDPADNAAPASVMAEAAAAGAAAAASAPAGYAVDDSVLAILREEAEREAQARRAEAAKPLEVQEDLGIDAAMPAARSSAMAPLEPVSAGMATSRTRLPDVEEIKSTLRPDETLVDTAEANGAAAPVEGRSSFRKGFSLVIVLAILGAALYVSADTLKAVVPALAGVLDAYVGLVDSLRLHLDGLMQSATLAINGT